MELPNLRKVRERKLITQAELGARSGVAETTINRIENGRNEARISTVRKLAEALGVEPSELMGDDSSSH